MDSSGMLVYWPPPSTFFLFLFLKGISDKLGWVGVLINRRHVSEYLKLTIHDELCEGI